MKKKRFYHNKKHVRRFILIPAIILFMGTCGLLWTLFHDRPYTKEDTQFGMTFSTKYSKELGIDWQQAYVESMDDLHIKRFRIPVYWDEIESEQGKIDLSQVQWIMDEAQKRDVKIILAIGNRVPRWPECHPPAWTKNYSTYDMQESELKMMGTVVNQFKDHPALDMWQVQNEPFLQLFGECPPPDEQFVSRSIAFVKNADPNHRVMTTDSGELSAWARAAGVADVVGVSVYRVTWNPLIGFFHYPVTPSFYSGKAKFIKPFVDDVFVSELQAEPWVSSTILTTPLEEQFRSMNVKRLNNNVDFARRIGFSRVYLWGVEWWFWLKEYHNEPSMWEAGKKIFSE